MGVFPKTFCGTWAVGCQKLIQYMRMLCPGRFILVESVGMPGNSEFTLKKRHLWRLLSQLQRPIWPSFLFQIMRIFKGFGWLYVMSLCQKCPCRLWYVFSNPKLIQSNNLNQGKIDLWNWIPKGFYAWFVSLLIKNNAFQYNFL